MSIVNLIPNSIGKFTNNVMIIDVQPENENYNKILTSEHFSTLYHSNYARILSFNENDF